MRHYGRLVPYGAILLRECLEQLRTEYGYTKQKEIALRARHRNEAGQLRIHGKEGTTGRLPVPAAARHKSRTH